MVPMPLISILHPTARVKPSEAFPRGWKDAHDAWLAKADHPERIEYILTVHESRWADFSQAEGYGSLPSSWCRVSASGGRHWQEFEAIKNTGRDCVVDQTNLAAEAAVGQIIVGIHDDYFPPEHWDTLLIEALTDTVSGEGYWDEPIILLCSTGATSERDRELMIGGVWTRPVYKHFGHILDPDFESMYADNWLVHEVRRDEVAGQLRVIERLDIQFEHRHPSLGKGQTDDIYALQNRAAAYHNGYNTFARKAGLPQRRSIAVCLPGEEFRSEWVCRWTMLFGHLTQVHSFMSLPFFGHSSNVYCTRIEMAKGVLESPIPCDFSLWIDDDNTLTPAHFDMLLKDLDEHPELDGVVGWCWCDNHQAESVEANKWTMSVGRQGPNMECYRFTLEDFQRADGALLGSDQITAPDGFWSGFPCVLLRREALERLGEGAFAPVCRPDINYGFSGEDTAFFWRARQLGMKFAVDVRVQVPHVKWRVIEPIWNLALRPCECVTPAGPPWYASRCKLAQGHIEEHDFGTIKEAREVFNVGVRASLESDRPRRQDEEWRVGVPGHPDNEMGM